MLLKYMYGKCPLYPPPGKLGIFNLVSVMSDIIDSR